jgi:SAM-dependent methyltransferase
MTAEYFNQWYADLAASVEAIRQATLRRALFGLERTATFRVGHLEHTGMDDGIADATICIDAIQFATSGAAAAAEMRRILRPGGRTVLTCWEPVDPADESVLDRIRRVNLADSLNAAGFRDIDVQQHVDWHDNERLLWEHALTLDPAGDPALESTRAEARRSLESHHKVRRVMATATAP